MVPTPMSTTTEPKKSPKTSVGQLLKQRRLSAGLSLKEVEIATRIRGKYLLAIESDNYSALPPDVYSKGFVSSYANYLGLDGHGIAAKYAKERGGQPVRMARPKADVASGPRVSSRGLAAVSLVGVLLAVLGYLFWQFSALTAAPRLTVSNPDKDQVLYGSLITINGRVDGGADVYVNDSPILSDANGNFTDAIALQDGINAIRVTARNRLGKSTTVTRNVLAHVPKTDPASALPAQPFNGVAAKIQIKDATASVTVKADDKEAFNGTMLPGTVQTFKAAEKLVISTTNAGATQLVITNSIVAGQDFGTVGPMGQEKTGLEFAKDTRFQ